MDNHSSNITTSKVFMLMGKWQCLESAGGVHLLLFKNISSLIKLCPYLTSSSYISNILHAVCCLHAVYLLPYGKSLFAV